MAAAEASVASVAAAHAAAAGAADAASFPQKQTKLTAFFHLRATDSEARAILYKDVVRNYVWIQNEKLEKTAKECQRRHVSRPEAYGIAARRRTILPATAAVARSRADVV